MVLGSSVDRRQSKELVMMTYRASYFPTVQVVLGSSLDDGRRGSGTIEKQREAVD